MNNSELVLALKAAVRRERAAVADVLRYLREVEKRKLFLESYSSLFAFCVGELGYSESEAMVRINSMRLMRAVPEVEKKIEQGELSMTVAASILSAVRREELPLKETRALVSELTGASKREAEKKLAEKFPEAPKPERVKPVADQVEIRFTVSREDAELIQKLMDHRAHTNFERSHGKLFVQLAKEALKKLEGKQPQDALPHGPAKVNSRYVSTKLKRAIWKRDKGRCQQCGTTHGLQIDHIRPFKDGGPTQLENLRLLCGTHNRARSG